MTSLASLRPPLAARIGDEIGAVATPALMLALDAFEQNIARMAALTRQAGVALRPHAKAHKSSAIAEIQVAAGAVGICCQKLSEAYPFAARGIADIHISNEFVGADKLAMAVELARHVRLSVCVDDLAQIDALGQAAARAAVAITVLPEVDIGQGRCGVSGDTELLALVERIAHYPALRFGGLQAYHGGIQHQADWQARRAAAARAAERTAHFVQLLGARGMACAVVTGGGTGTVEFDVASGVYTEVQPGSYVFMDRHYGANEWSGQVRPQHSLFLATTVMSCAKEGLAVCDVGLKSVAVDSGLPLLAPQSPAGLVFGSANDEHGILQCGAARPQVALGERLYLIPGHCDPTANLHDQYVGYRGTHVEAIFAIDARGLSR